MATVLNTLETRYTANIIDMERAAKRLNKLHDKFASDVEKSHNKAANDTAKVWKNAKIGDAIKAQSAGVDSLKNSLVSLAPALAAAFSVREAIAAADSYTRFTNSLKVAGLEGRNLEQVQDALFASAQKNGVALEPLSQLYGRAAQSAGELGASQADLLKFTDGVTAALRVQGGDAASASGALMQLSQALSAGTVRAEEFNSINEGARPILEAVAAGNDKFGGSVAKLRAYMLEGKLTSQEMFQSFLVGSTMLETKAAKAPLTVAASLNLLTNAMAKYIGEADTSLSASERLSKGIETLANNLDTVALAIAVVGGAITGKMLAPLIQSRVAMGLASIEAIRYQAALGSMAVAQGTMTAGALRSAAAMGTLRTAMAFLGGPWTIAITAIGAALGFLAMKNLEAAKATNELNSRIDANAKRLDDAEAAAAKARTETGLLTGAQMKAATEAANLTGEVDLLTQAHYRAAAAAKAQAIELANVRVEQAKTDLAGAERQKGLARQKIERNVRGPIEPGSRGAAGGAATVGLDPTRIIDGATATTKEAERVAKAQRELDAARADLKAVENRSIKDPEFAPPSAAAAASDGKGKGSKASGPSAQELADRREQLRLQNELEVAKARGDTNRIASLERELELRRLIDQFEQAGLKTAEAKAAAEAQVYAKDWARLQYLKENPTITAAKSPDFNPDGFESSEDRMKPILDGIREHQDELREGFASAFRGGIEAGMRDGLPGIMEYFGNALRQKAIDNFVNIIANSLFPSGGIGMSGGGGILGGIFKMFGGHASGALSSPGGWRWAGERGPELINFNPGSAVIRNDMLRVNTNVPKRENGVPAVHFHTNVDAKDAVLAGQVQQWIADGNQRAVQTARQLTKADLGRSNQQRLY